jgi:hypothetical protein
MPHPLHTPDRRWHTGQRPTNDRTTGGSRKGTMVGIAKTASAPGTYLPSSLTHQRPERRCWPSRNPESAQHCNIPELSITPFS